MSYNSVQPISNTIYDIINIIWAYKKSNEVDFE